MTILLQNRADYQIIGEIVMRAYLITTAIIFALIIVAHVARLLTHDLRAATEPSFLFASVVSIAMFAWAVLLILKDRR